MKSADRLTFDDLDEPTFERTAERLASFLRPGDVVILSGEVGAGKTTFVRAAARALGVKERVTSPTYQLARSYETFSGGERLTVNHLDLYRLEGIGVEDSLELEEYLSPDAVTFVEWAEPAAGALEAPSVVFIEHRSPQTRRLSVEGPLAERVGRRPC